MSENSEELISKKDAIAAICAGFRVMNEEEDKRTVLERCKANVMKKKGYKPDREKGRWIPEYGNMKCSVCGHCKDAREVGKSTHYCSFCGIEMESEGTEE